MKVKFFSLLSTAILLSACQNSNLSTSNNSNASNIINWVNQQTITETQKKSMLQLSQALQKLNSIENIPDSQKFNIAKENAIARHCAHLQLNEQQIEQLQEQVLGKDKQRILEIYDQQFPKLKIDINSIQCQ